MRLLGRQHRSTGLPKPTGELSLPAFSLASEKGFCDVEQFGLHEDAGHGSWATAASHGLYDRPFRRYTIISMEQCRWR